VKEREKTLALDKEREEKKGKSDDNSHIREKWDKNCITRGFVVGSKNKQHVHSLGTHSTHKHTRC